VLVSGQEEMDEPAVDPVRSVADRHPDEVSAVGPGQEPDSQEFSLINVIVSVPLLETLHHPDDGRPVQGGQSNRRQDEREGSEKLRGLDVACHEGPVSVISCSVDDLLDSGPEDGDQGGAEEEEFLDTPPLEVLFASTSLESKTAKPGTGE
jgi:hypothetical protein